MADEKDKKTTTETAQEVPVETIEIEQYFNEDVINKERNIQKLNKDRTNIYFAALSNLFSKYDEKIYYLRSRDELGNIKNEYDRTGTSIYQLDSVPKIVAEKLKENGDTLDKLILLCTKEVFKVSQTQIRYRDGRKVNTQTNAINFFYNNIKSYLGDNSIPPEDRVEIIQIDSFNPSEGIQAAIKCVMNETKPHIYIDPHGGPRNTQLISVAISSLLETTKAAVIETVYDVQSDPNKDYITIFDGDETIKINEFVSGINEFVNHGRTTSLEKYLGANHSDLVVAMKEVSEGLSFGNVRVFDEGLKDLRAFFDENSNKENKDYYLTLFERAIRKDYGKLYSEDCKVVDKIAWCMKKGLYQQALIFMEAMMPDELLDKNVIQINKDLIELDKSVRENCITTGDIFNGYIFKYILGSNINKYKGIKSVSTKTINNGEPFRVQYSRNKNTLNINCNRSVLTFPSELRTDFIRLLSLHRGLKKIRNNSAHVLDKDFDNNKVSEALEGYIVLAKQLYASAKKLSE